MVRSSNLVFGFRERKTLIKHYDKWFRSLKKITSPKALITILKGSFVKHMPAKALKRLMFTRAWNYRSYVNAKIAYVDSNLSIDYTILENVHSYPFILCVLILNTSCFTCNLKSISNCRYLKWFRCNFIYFQSSCQNSSFVQKSVVRSRC